MRATIDKAGRLIIPKALRVEPPAGDSLDERDGRWLIPAGGAEINDEMVRTLRDAGQR